MRLARCAVAVSRTCQICATDRPVAGAAELVAPPRRTPWGSRDADLEGAGASPSSRFSGASTTTESVLRAGLSRLTARTFGTGC
jgi:hypothetical protein